MSTAVMAKVWPLQMPGVPKSVLVSLADNANDHGVCWPSISTICTRTCFQRTAVMEAIGWLEQQGYLHAEKRPGRNTRYYITVPSADLFHGEQPVRQPDQSAKRTSPRGEPHPSASRTAPVRQPDTNHQEPSVTVNSLSECAKAMIAAGFPAMRMNHSDPRLLLAAETCTPQELGDVVREYAAAHGGAPPGLAYVCTTALNRRRDAARESNPANQTEGRRRDRPTGRDSLADRAARRAREVFADG